MNALPLSSSQSIETPRAGLGSFLRVILEFLDARDLRAQVLALVSDETRRYAANPPWPFSWVPSTPIDELERAIGEVGGDALLLDLGERVARELGSSMVQPVLRAAFFLFGERVESVFPHLDRYFSLITRGLSFHWTPQPWGGLLEARFSGPGTPRAALVVLQGTLRWPFALLNAQGDIGAPDIVRSDSQGTVARYEVTFGH